MLIQNIDQNIPLSTGEKPVVKLHKDVQTIIMEQFIDSLLWTGFY